MTPQGSYAERGRPMTTGAHSGGDDRGRASTSVLFGGGGVVGGPLTLRGRTLRGDAR